MVSTGIIIKRNKKRGNTRQVQVEDVMPKKRHLCEKASADYDQIFLKTPNEPKKTDDYTIVVPNNW